MSRLSLTDFVDVVSSSGMPKANKVKEIKNRDDYHPAFDYYKGLRDHIVNVHKNSQDKSLIKNATSKANNPNKLTNYSAISNFYHSWWGRKTIEWFDPKSGHFEKHNVSVSINPELGLVINGEPHLVKLYFKTDKLTKNRIDIITFLMEDTLSGKLDNNPSMSVLDIRRKKMFTGNNVLNLEDVLSAELAYVSALLS